MIKKTPGKLRKRKYIEGSGAHFWVSVHAEIVEAVFFKRAFPQTKVASPSGLVAELACSRAPGLEPQSRLSKPPAPHRLGLCWAPRWLSLRASSEHHRAPAVGPLNIAIAMIAAKVAAGSRSGFAPVIRSKAAAATTNLALASPGVAPLLPSACHHRLELTRASEAALELPRRRRY